MEKETGVKRKDTMAVATSFQLPFVLWPVLALIEVMATTSEWETKPFFERANSEQSKIEISATLLGN